MPKKKLHLNGFTVEIPELKKLHITTNQMFSQSDDFSNEVEGPEKISPLWYGILLIVASLWMTGSEGRAT